MKKLFLIIVITLFLVGCGSINKDLIKSQENSLDLIDDAIELLEICAADAPVISDGIVTLKENQEKQRKLLEEAKKEND